MAYFHINDLNQTPTTSVCTNNELHVFGLRSDQVILHIDPSFMQRDNGLMVGIDSRFKHFYIVNQNHVIEDELEIEWRDCMQSDYQVQINEIDKEEPAKPLFVISFIVLLLFLYVIKRGIRCKRF